MNLRARLTPYAMVAPSMFVFIACYMAPIAYMFFLSLHEWDFVSPVMNFRGLGNFVSLFRKEEFLQVLGNTFTFTAASVFATISIATGLAVWLNSFRRTHRFVQAVIFTPHIISLVSVAFVWMWLMDPYFGLLNYGFKLAGLKGSAWLQHPSTAMLSLIVVAVWKLVGYDTLILIAAMQAIPKSILEAAELDRAPPRTVFFRIVLPMISPSLFFLLIMNTLSLFQNFDTVAIMTQGGPLNSTSTLVYYIYVNAFRYYKLGYASAAGVVLFGVVGLLTIAYFSVLGRKVHYR